MSDRVTIIFALCIIGAVIADVVIMGGANVIFLGRKLIELTEYIAFWR